MTQNLCGVIVGKTTHVLDVCCTKGRGHKGGHSHLPVTEVKGYVLAPVIKGGSWIFDEQLPDHPARGSMVPATITFEKK